MAGLTVSLRAPCRQRDRRKLHVEPLHLPPEDARDLTEDVEKQSGNARRKVSDRIWKEALHSA
jgi:hypothetical protein